MAYTYEYSHPSVAADVVLFTVRDNALNVLLIQRDIEPYRGKWAIPGGFVRDTETVHQAAERELREEAGVRANLHPLEIFDAPRRDIRRGGSDSAPYRVISVAYLGLVNAAAIHPQAGSEVKVVGWRAFPEGGAIEGLAFDHAQILHQARAKLAKLVHASPDLLKDLMPKEFTLGELYRQCSVVFGDLDPTNPLLGRPRISSKPADEATRRKNFYKKFRGGRSAIVATRRFQQPEQGGRPARLYTFI